MKNLKAYVLFNFLLLPFIYGSYIESNYSKSFQWDYQENFDNEFPKDWGEGKNTSSEKIENGELHIFHKVSFLGSCMGKMGWWWWTINKEMELDNFIYEAKVKWNSGNKDYDFGIIFGREDINNLYTFGINSKGEFNLFKIKDGKSKTLIWKNLSLLNRDNKPNILRVEMFDGTIKLYINNEFVFSFKDETPLKGKIGLFSSFGVHASFDEIKIKRLDNKKDEGRINGETKD